MNDNTLEPTKVGEASDLIYSIRNLCDIFDTIRDCAPNSLKLMPIIMEEIYCKAQSLVVALLEKRTDK